MAREINRLNSRFVDAAPRGKHRDGNGLLLIVSPTGSRKWIFAYQFRGREREMGLGSAGRFAVSLAEARMKADAARRLLRDGIDPIEAKRSTAKTDIPTFGQFADDYVETHTPGWRNAKHAGQWAMVLREYAKAIRDKPLNEIDTGDILELLKPLWQRVPETASRTRARIENVLDAAKAKGLRTGENPARWRGHLDQLLPKRQKLTRGHHAALPYDKVPEFIQTLRERESTAALAFEFLILTAGRSGEVLGARFDEVDFEKRVWTVPASRTKAGRDHRVPLTDRAIAIVRKLYEARTGEFIFPGLHRPHLSNMALAMALRRMKYEDVTAHGFRSSFRDWASETTSFPHEVCEMALAHAIASKTEAAYRRGDLFEKRRELMAAWGGYCEPRKEAKVIALRGER